MDYAFFTLFSWAYSDITDFLLFKSSFSSFFLDL